MRTLALLAALLLSVGGLAGCVGDKADPVNSNQVDTKDPTSGSTGGTDAGSIISVLAPLDLTISTTEDLKWLAPGSTFPVSAAAPANAEGNVTYTWAIGSHPDAVAAPDVALDTGPIEGGASKALTYTAAGVYRMHCHPHPWMKHNVTVVEGFEGPAAVTVKIVDGATEGSYRFVPENIIVAPGTVVTYQNIGDQMHTATLEAAEPSLKKLELSTAEGDVTLEGDGWMRVVVVAKDSKGRIGIATQNVYVKAIPANFEQTFTGEFQATDPSGGTLGISPPATHAANFAHGGKATLAVTVTDPAGVGQVKVHLIQQGVAQDAATVNPGESAGQATVNAGQHTVKVDAAQGAQLSYSIVLKVVYDLVPPALEKAAAGGGDGHGDHAGH